MRNWLKIGFMTKKKLAVKRVEVFCLSSVIILYFKKIYFHLDPFKKDLSPALLPTRHIRLIICLNAIQNI